MINVKQCVDVQMTLTCCRNLSICLLGFEYRFAISSLEVIFNRQVQEESSAHHYQHFPFILYLQVLVQGVDH